MPDTLTVMKRAILDEISEVSRRLNERYELRVDAERLCREAEKNERDTLGRLTMALEAADAAGIKLQSDLPSPAKERVESARRRYRFEQ